MTLTNSPSPASCNGCPGWRQAKSVAGCGGGLHGLLVLAHLGQRGVVGDVGDGAQRALLAVDAGRLPPPGGRDVELLGQQRHEDLRLLLAEPGQLPNSCDEFLATVDTGPDVRCL